MKIHHNNLNSDVIELDLKIVCEYFCFHYFVFRKIFPQFHPSPSSLSPHHTPLIIHPVIIQPSSFTPHHSPLITHPHHLT